MNERLSKNELEILKYLSSRQGFYESAMSLTTVESLAIKFQIDSFELRDCIKHLTEIRFIEEKTEKNENDEVKKYYAPTTQGKNYLEFLETDHQEKLKWSIQVPIAVAVVTTLLVNLITYLFQK
ncbi:MULTISPECIES: hypothetical protein [Bacteria]|uniref:hypothetical protein n=1 Tax=Bacteria TaxID=2 RepID=UPI000BBD3F23|nr:MULTISPECIES: hypothetical protein [Enterococcus]ATF73052.1 hypothetical protein CO692_13660 [Enterococcus sp. FDAARGOS_375]